MYNQFEQRSCFSQRKYSLAIRTFLRFGKIVSKPVNRVGGGGGGGRGFVLLEIILFDVLKVVCNNNDYNI